MGKIIVLGSINMDVVVTAPRHPQIGETIFGNEVHFIPGGKGSNQAVAAARLDGEVQLIGKLGEDRFGVLHPEWLKAEDLTSKVNKTVKASHPAAANRQRAERCAKTPKIPKCQPDLPRAPALHKFGCRFQRDDRPAPQFRAWDTPA